MKLFFAPGTCAQAVHIVLREVGVPFSLERVFLGKKQLKDGSNYLEINPNGYVPALQLDDETILTEAAMLVQYAADLKPEAKLIPPHGSLERYKLQSVLNYLATEVHKSFSTLFNKSAPEEWKTAVREALGKRLDYLDGVLSKQSHLLGEQFSCADAYLFVLLGWSKFVGIDLAKWSALAAYRERVGNREAVKAAIAAENA